MEDNLTFALYEVICEKSVKNTILKVQEKVRKYGYF